MPLDTRFSRRAASLYSSACLSGKISINDVAAALPRLYHPSNISRRIQNTHL
jgi:hypothetical protein